MGHTHPQDSVRSDTQTFSGQQITVVGAGVSGISLARFAAARGASVMVSDQKSVRQEHRALFSDEGIAWEEQHSDRALQTDRLVLSSGIAPHAPLVQEALRRGIPVFGELDFLAPHLQGTLVGITGSNGKSTTTTLLGHLLQKPGRKVAVAGNVGIPLGDVAGFPWDVVVMELSSFQLHWTSSLPLHFGIITNLDPDHIDWHGSYEAYVASKMHLFNGLTSKGRIVVQRRELESVPQHYRDRTIPLSWEDASEGIVITPERAVLRQSERELLLFQRENLPLLGRHNMENSAMAMTIASFLGEDPQTIVPRLATYEPLPHRCALIGRWNDITFVDDSKGTNVAACVTALRSLEGEKVVILGGRGKGEKYDVLTAAVKDRARIAIVLGEERPRLVNALQSQNKASIVEVQDMAEAVQEAFRQALPGETVLLSPACTSWDAYANYEERGDHFARLVRAEIARRTGKMLPEGIQEVSS